MIFGLGILEVLIGLGWLASAAVPLWPYTRLWWAEPDGRTDLYGVMLGVVTVGLGTLWIVQSV